MTTIPDSRAEWVTDAIRNHLLEIEDHSPGLLSEAFDARESEAKHAGATVEEIIARDAIEAIVGPVLWRRSIGETWNTTEVTQILGITRQAVAMRVRYNSLLALPGRHSRLYPVWQFDIVHGDVRPVVATVLRRWRQAEPDVEPITIATWATTATPWDGEHVVPAELVAGGSDDDVVLSLADDVIARRTR